MKYYDWIPIIGFFTFYYKAIFKNDELNETTSDDTLLIWLMVSFIIHLPTMFGLIWILTIGLP